MTTTKKTPIGVLALLLGSMQAAALADVAVIAGPSVPVDSLGMEQVRRLYLNQAGRFPGGVALVPYDQPRSSDIHKAFTKRVLRKSERELAQYWSRRMFSGKGRPPQVLADDAAVIEQVTRVPGSIGYVDSGSLNNDRVKVLLRLP